jgi:hypothetical protein
VEIVRELEHSRVLMGARVFLGGSDAKIHQDLGPSLLSDVADDPRLTTLVAAGTRFWATVELSRGRVYRPRANTSEIESPSWIGRMTWTQPLLTFAP